MTCRNIGMSDLFGFELLDRTGCGTIDSRLSAKVSAVGGEGGPRRSGPPDPSRVSTKWLVAPGEGGPGISPPIIDA